jgi:hypothetical protein
MGSRNWFLSTDPADRLLLVDTVYSHRSLRVNLTMFYYSNDV